MICRTISDCGGPPTQAGYVATQDGTTVDGQTASVDCDTGYTGSSFSITCAVGGWTPAYSGCSTAGGTGINYPDKSPGNMSMKCIPP